MVHCRYHSGSGCSNDSPDGSVKLREVDRLCKKGTGGRDNVSRIEGCVGLNDGQTANRIARCSTISPVHDDGESLPIELCDVG